MITTKILKISDINDIEKCILSHKTMYGVSIQHDYHIKKYKELITNGVYQNKYKGLAVGAYENDSCVGVCTQLFWQNMPIWNPSNLFILNQDDSFLYLSIKKIEILGALLDKMINIAEKVNYFEFYYIVRDSVKQTRLNKGLQKIFPITYPSISNRYLFFDTQILKSINDIKYATTDTMLGEVGKAALIPPNNKTLIVRKAILKPELWNIINSSI